MHIARDCLANRQRRIDYDLVQDAAEKELLKEIELISQVQVLSFIVCSIYDWEIQQGHLEPYPAADQGPAGGM